ncbi:hypothetical protein BEI60_15410 [Eisenbergiella tayi]|nr:hypothetical protein BEI60_15410 [Eisenbergiella tayi]
MSYQKVEIFCRKYSIYIVYLALTILTAYLCFNKLDIALIQHWDEARHGVNGYEMYMTHNYIGNTYNYENDYFNLKPPLSYWFIMLGFKLFGVSIFSMRFYSAAALLLTFIIVGIYMHKYYGRIATVSTMLLFISCSDLFYRHAGRNADADALYILLFTAALLLMLRTKEHPRFIYACGFLFSLAFLAKSWHALILLAIGGLYLIFSGLWKGLKVKYYFVFILCAFGPIFLWAIARYQYDGMAFLGQMFGVDVTQRFADSATYNKGYSFFTKYLLTYPPILLAILIISLLTILLIFKKKIHYNNTFLGYALWIFVPLLVYDFSHTYYYWYIFPVYIPLIMLAGILLHKIYQNAVNKAFFWVLLLVPMFFTIINCRNTIAGLENLEISGFQNDLAAAMEKYPQYRGMDVYVQKTDNEYKEDSYWEQGGLLAAELSGDLKCREGGISKFLDAENSCLLIVDTETYENSYNQLQEYGILFEKEYILLGSFK